MAPPNSPRGVPTPVAQPGSTYASVAATIPLGRGDAQLTSLDAQTPDLTAKQQAQDYVQAVIRQWRVVDQAESRLRKDQKKDGEFYASDQWPEHIKKQRDLDGRPCLTINRLPGFVRQVTNEARESKPGIEVEAVDNYSDPDLAEVQMGLIQHVEANSDADVAYATAVESQARIGRGWFRIIPEYASDNSFEQELRIKRVRNPHTVYADPAYQELDGSDMRFCIIVEDCPKDQYVERFGRESMASLEQFYRAGQSAQDWMPEGKIRIAEVYSFRPVKKTIHRMQNGVVLEESDLQDPTIQAKLAELGVPLAPVLSRKVNGKQLTWALINAETILDGNDDTSGPRDMPGRWIPMLPVVGEELDLDGRMDYRGIVRDAIDSQRVSNYWKSAQTESVALAPKAPWIAEEGQIENHEAEWQAANTRNIAVLKYKHVSIGGNTLVPPPQRNFGEPPINAMLNLSMQAENDIRATAGFSFDVGAHEQRPEQSGKAILARQRQGEIGNSHYLAHLGVALRHAGRILLDLFPHYYDTPRIKRILGRDGQQKQVLLHAGNPKAAQEEAQRQGLAENRIYDLSSGRYDVRVKAGTSFASQRAEDRELMTYALQTNPQLMQLIGDLYFASMDSPISRRISERLQKALPPPLQDPKEGDQPPIPPEFMQQYQEQAKMIEALTAQQKELIDAVDGKKLELASRERIAQIQSETAISIAQSKAQSAEAIALLEARMDELAQLVNIDMTRIDKGLSLAQKQIEHDHASQEAEAARQHDLALANKTAETQVSVAREKAKAKPAPAAKKKE